MSCFQASLCIKSNELLISKVGVRHVSRPPRVPSILSVLPICANHFSRTTVKLTSGASTPQLFAPLLGHKKGICVSRFHKRSLVCFLGGKDKDVGENEGSPPGAAENAKEGSAENAKEGYKKSSIEDVLWNQIQKKEYYDGGKGGKPPRDKSGRGGGGGSGESEGVDFSQIMSETIQVVLATIGILILYACFINGEEFFLLLRDYITYLFRGSKSSRLMQVMDKWRRLQARLTSKSAYSKDW